MNNLRPKSLAPKPAMATTVSMPLKTLAGMQGNQATVVATARQSQPQAL